MAEGEMTIVKSKPTKAGVVVPLLHRGFNIKVSNPFFKGFNFCVFFSFRVNGRVRGLQVEVRVNLFNGLGIFLSCTPLMLCFSHQRVLGLAHPKEQAKNVPNRRWGFVSLLPSPSSSTRGEEPRGAAALLSSTGAFKSFLILNG
jgi:hypothetical protein